MLVDVETDIVIEREEVAAYAADPMETSYRWTPVDPGRTRMALRNRGNPSSFFRLTAPFVTRAMRRANTKDLQALKQILETA